MNEKSRASEDARPTRNKPERTPLGVRNRLTFRNLDPDYVYRVINDKDDRLKRAMEGGYEFVESQDQLGDKAVSDASKMGANVSKPVGHGMTGYLMRIRKEWYEEDQAKKQEAVIATERAMRPDKSKGEYKEGLISE